MANCLIFRIWPVYVYFWYINHLRYIIQRHIIMLNTIDSVIELSGGWEGSTPSSFFNPPACSQKLPWGQAKPPRPTFNNSIYLSLFFYQKISNTCEFQDDPIIRGYDSLEDYMYLHIYFSRCRTYRCSIFVHLCYIHRYV